MSLGNTGIVSWTLTEDDSVQLLKRAYDIGLNTWDTANTYSNGVSEETIGKALRKYEIPRHKVVIMTKLGFHVGETPDIMGPLHKESLERSKDYVNQAGRLPPNYPHEMPLIHAEGALLTIFENFGSGLSRSAIFSQVEGSLARLDTSYIDVLQLHRLDTTVPPEEIMKALHDLVQSGKVRYIGASSMWATQFAQLQFLAEKYGWTKFVSMQNYYNLCYREEEREMIRFCKDTGVGIIPWAPMYSGRLARPVGYDASARSKMPSAFHPGLTAADGEIIGRVEKVAEKKGWSMSQVALVWHKAKGSVPIVGLNSLARVEEMEELKGKVLTEEEVFFLEEPYVVRGVAGHS
jgi:aryl-alcohol dehydrogenase-like predicted oxidoreductase